jgi:hypothetical protein
VNFKKYIYPALLPLILAGCSSSLHYVGYHEMEHKRVYNLVSKKTEQAAKSFETKCLRAFIKSDSLKITQLFSNKLLDAIRADSLGMITHYLTKRYKINGKYTIKRNSVMLGGGIRNKALRLDGFEYFDYIRVAYLLYGKIDAEFDLYITRIAGQYKICGFTISDFDYGPYGNRIKLHRLAPETINKAGLQVDMTQ